MEKKKYPPQMYPKYYEPSNDAPCVCGSGRKFKNCCAKKYCSEALRQSSSFYNSGLYEKALKHTRYHLTWYILCVKAHTTNPLAAAFFKTSEMLKVDIEALSEILEQIHHCYYKTGRSKEFPQVISHLSSIIDDPRWELKIIYSQALWYLVDKDDDASAYQKIASVDIDTCTDHNILALYIHVVPQPVQFSRIINIIDRLICHTDSPAEKLQYTVLKGIKYFELSLQSEAEEIMTMAISDYRKLPEEKHSEYGDLQFASALGLYGDLRSDNTALKESLLITERLIEASINKNHSSVHLGDLLRTKGNALQSLKRTKDSIAAYEASLRVNPSEIIKVFLARSMLQENNIIAAKNTLTTVDIQQMDNGELLDLGLSWAFLAVLTRRKDDVQQAINALKRPTLHSPVWIKQRDKWLIDLLEIKPESDGGIISRLLSSLSKYAILTPNIFGVGINVNRIIDDAISAQGERPHLGK